MKNTLILFSVILLFACQGEKKDAFTDLEKSLTKQYDPKVKKELFDLYDKSIAEHPNDKAKNLEITYRKAVIMQNIKKNNAAVDILKQGLKSYYDGTNGQMNILLLAGIYYHNLDDKETGLSLYQIYEMVFPTSNKLKELESILSTADTTFFARAKYLGSNIYNADKGQIDFKLGKSFVRTCDYASLFMPKNKQATELLSLGAESAKNLKLTDASLEMYDRILTDHKDSDKAGQAAFMKAFIYDSDLKKYDEAKALYEKFIKSYPKNDFVDDAQALIQNLGKSEEELIKMFLEKNKKK